MSTDGGGGGNGSSATGSATTALSIVRSGDEKKNPVSKGRFVLKLSCDRIFWLYVMLDDLGALLTFAHHFVARKQEKMVCEGSFGATL